MGIPSYFSWLTRHFGDEIISDLNPDQIVDNLYLDFNCAIHPACRSRPESSFEDMEEVVILYLSYIIQVAQPKELLYIAIDGSAPWGKMKQQHTRRFKAVAETQANNKLKAKYGIAINENQQKDFNAISPGTIFMDNLSKRIKLYLQTHHKNLYQHLKIIFSDASRPQEGEHKIIQHIKTQPLNKHCVIYGLDSDLILLSLSLHRPNVILLRENTLIKSNNLDLDINQYPQMSYFLISELRQKIIMIMNPFTTLGELEGLNIFSFNKNDTHPHEVQLTQMRIQNPTFFTTETDSNRIINDYIFLSFFLGNDFIGACEALKIREKGIEHVMRAYKKVIQKRLEFLVYDDYTINVQFLTDLIRCLVPLEESILRKQKIDRDRRIKFNQTKAKPRTYEEALELDSNVDGLYQDTINAFQDGWRDRYYHQRFHFQPTNTYNLQNQKTLICTEYIKTLHWIAKYYFIGCPDWHYVYPYEVPPLLNDLLIYLETYPTKINDVVFSVNQPINPYHQLLMILPPQSSHLLPKPYANLMTNPDSPLIAFFPTQFKFDYYGKRFKWECHPLIPMMNSSDLDQYVCHLDSQLTLDERQRCQLGQLFELN